MSLKAAAGCAEYIEMTTVNSRQWTAGYPLPTRHRWRLPFTILLGLLVACSRTPAPAPAPTTLPPPATPLPPSPPPTREERPTQPPTAPPTRPPPSPTGTPVAPTATVVPATPIVIPPATLQAEALPPGAHVVPVVAGADFPVALAFAPDGRLFYTEKNTGNVRVIVDGRLQDRPVITLPTDDFFERGMLGIALDPDFAHNHFIWIYHTLRRPLLNRVVRFVERDGIGINATGVFTSPIDGPGNHNGGNVHFGPDGMFYVTVGENASPRYSQNLGDVRGKIHRFQPTAPLTAPPDNPFSPDPAVAIKSIYAYGLRNSFDFDFDPLSGRMFATENGPDCDDELNLILPGGDYGWRPGVPCGDMDPRFNHPVLPLVRYTPTIAPTGITFYRGSLIPEWRNDLFFCAYNNGVMYHVKLMPNRQAIASISTVNLGGVACSLDIETGPDGGLYFTNTQGIYRITR